MKYPVLIALLATFAVSLDPGGSLSSFERKTLDARHRFHARPAPHTQDIVILHISEESIRRLAPFYGRWPWPRSVHAEAVEYLESDGARAIGFDFASDPALAEAMARARDTGEPAASQKLTHLPIWNSSWRGTVLLFIPVYRAAAPAQTAEARRDALIGFVFRMTRSAKPAVTSRSRSS